MRFVVLNLLSIIECEKGQTNSICFSSLLLSSDSFAKLTPKKQEKEKDKKKLGLNRFFFHLNSFQFQKNAGEKKRIYLQCGCFAFVHMPLFIIPFEIQIHNANCARNDEKKKPTKDLYSLKMNTSEEQTREVKRNKKERLTAKKNLK